MASSTSANFVCSLCGVTFGRSEHLIRHVLAHQGNKPYSCPTCQKSFNRRDSLSRHVPTHITALSNGKQGTAARVSKACKNCAQSRLRCNGEKPCARCTSAGLGCVYDGRSRKRIPTVEELQQANASPDDAASKEVAFPQPAVSSVPPASTDAGPLGSASAIGLPNEGSATSSDQYNTNVDFPEDFTFYGMSTSAGEADPPAVRTQRGVPTPYQSTAMFRESNEVPPRADVQRQTVLGNNSMATCTEPTGQWASEFGFLDWITVQPGYEANTNILLPLSPPLTSFNPYEEADSTLLSLRQVVMEDSNSPYGEISQTLRPHQPSQLDGTLGNASVHDDPRTTSSPRMIRSVPSQAASNPKRHWPTEWDPAKSDNLVVFPDMTRVPDDVLDAESLGHVEQIGQQAYNEILCCMRRVGIDRNHFRPFANPNLPPIEAMDCFVQLYFEHFHPTFPLLHKPSFNPSYYPWQLSLATAAIGCRYSKVNGAGKMANALQELLRRAIGDTIESDNSHARELWFTQTVMLNFLGMMYSGNRRFVELAEILRNCFITQCRRNGALKRTEKEHSVSVLPSTNGALLDGQWRKWIHEESHRRMGFCAFILDAQVVLYLDLNPCLAVQELQQPLPCTEEVWEASNPESWKSLVLEKGRAPADTVNSILATMRRNQPISSPAGGFARLILVFAIYLSATAILRLPQNPLFLELEPTNILVEDLLSSTVRMLETLWPDDIDRRENAMRYAVESHILLVLNMLFVPRASLLRYAHDVGTKTSQHAIPGEIMHWIAVNDGKTARRATAYAGRLIGTLRTQPSPGFHEPVALLLGTMTLWMFSIVAGDLPTVTGAGSTTWKERGTIVRLDRLETDRGCTEWIEDGANLRGYLSDVGSISRPGAAARILENGIRMLKSLPVWAIGEGLGLWLSALHHLQGPALVEL